MPKRKIPTVFVVSDGHGDTAHQVLNAAVMQFEDRDYTLVVKRDVRTPEAVAKIVEQAAKAKAAVFYTLVEEATRRAMREAASRLVVHTVDILGPAFRALDDVLHHGRGATPGLMYAIEKERIERMQAIDYTLTHDDGQRVRDLDQADVVLVGISRTSKSSTCFYLACAGIRAANVPLVMGVEPAPELLALSSKKVIGLRINTQRLSIIREARAQNLKMTASDAYLETRSIAREAAWANRLMDAHGWRSFDASYMAIEEMAKEVLRLIGLGGPRPW